MADAKPKPIFTPEEAKAAAAEQAAIQEAITPAPAVEPDPTDPRQKARAAELERQKAVVDAVHAATHDANGKPIPLGVVDLPQPPGITVVEGKP